MLLILGLKLQVIEDSCLYDKYIRCTQFGYWNPDSVMSNKCNGADNFDYAKGRFRVVFSEYLFQTKEGEELRLNYHQIDSILTLNNNFTKTGKELSELNNLFGNFNLIKVIPADIDSTLISARCYDIGFNKYSNVDSILNHLLFSYIWQRFIQIRLRFVSAFKEQIIQHIRKCSKKSVNNSYYT